jgi:acetyl-CoA carboxylase carboxyl transferase subunit alpha
MRDFLEFEKPLKELEERLEKLRKSGSERKALPRLIRMLQSRLTKTEQEIFGNLTPWQQTQIARHPQRPSILDYMKHMCEDFLELHGDRTFGDDKAVVGGFATFRGRSICVIGHVKGQSFKERVKRNFGMANPEGYRKALRLMQLGEKFKRPVVTFIDTPGAYPGIGAEERGQARAIARNLFAMSRLRVPIVAIIAGEGGSGGALALGVADRIVMLEHSIYSVISPEGCAAILWEDATKTQAAAAALKMTGAELLKLGIADEVVPEPLGGAHRDVEDTSQSLAQTLHTQLNQLLTTSTEQLLANRYEKFRQMAALADV